MKEISVDNKEKLLKIAENLFPYDKDNVTDDINAYKRQIYLLGAEAYHKMLNSERGWVRPVNYAYAPNVMLIPARLMIKSVDLDNNKATVINASQSEFEIELDKIYQTEDECPQR